MPEDEPEIELEGGTVNGAVMRVGDTVRRNTGPWTPSVHALLRHLEGAGFPYSSRVLGIDAKGREVLGYIDGVTGNIPWPEALSRTRPSSPSRDSSANTMMPSRPSCRRRAPSGATRTAGRLRAKSCVTATSVLGT
jgi:hypothetical protein